MKILVFILFVSSAFATDKLYRIKNLSVIMSVENGVIANRDCLKQPDRCEALVAAKKYAKHSLPSNGKNPLAEKCKHILKGEVVIGTDEKGNENSFCRFRDHSVISCSSLSQFE